MSTSPLTLRFTEWRCGHRAQRPDDIPVHSIEQAQLILQAVANAISQPGHARAALFNETSGVSIYVTDDDAEPIPSRWPSRTVVYHGSDAEVADVLALGPAFDHAYGGKLVKWDGLQWLDDMEVITTLSAAEIEAAIQPLEWWQEGERHAVCDLPPVLKPAFGLLSELREAAAEMAQEEAGSST